MYEQMDCLINILVGEEEQVAKLTLSTNFLQLYQLCGNSPHYCGDVASKSTI